MLQARRYRSMRYLLICHDVPHLDPGTYRLEVGGPSEGR